jgi:hypothetical protein
VFISVHTTMWARDRGWWLGRDSHGPTHLLLDGGKLRVPDDAAGAFLNAYALEVFRSLQSSNPVAQSPSVVELRTPVFRLFLDLDIKFTDADPGDAVVLATQRCVSEFFEVDLPRVVEATTTPTTLPTGATKAGRHLVWTDVYVSTPTALAFRRHLLDHLSQTELRAANAWDDVVDKCVFVSNGLRMPWSAKGKASSAVYAPARLLYGDETVRIDPPKGVTEVRGWTRDMSIRAFGREETPLRPGVVCQVDCADDHPGTTLHGTAKRLADFPAAQQVVRCLPAEYADAKVVAILQTESCFILKTNSRWCMNVDRNHANSSTFLVLSLKGVRCGCFCRKDDVSDRKWGACRDYRSDTYAVPDDVMQAFFGAGVGPGVPGAFKPVALPSVNAASTTASLLSQSRPPLVRLRSKRKK